MAISAKPRGVKKRKTLSKRSIAQLDKSNKRILAGLKRRNSSSDTFVKGAMTTTIKEAEKLIEYGASPKTVSEHLAKGIDWIRHVRKLRDSSKKRKSK